MLGPLGRTHDEASRLFRQRRECVQAHHRRTHASRFPTSMICPFRAWRRLRRRSGRSTEEAELRECLLAAARHEPVQAMWWSRPPMPMFSCGSHRTATVASPPRNRSPGATGLPTKRTKADVDVVIFRREENHLGVAGRQVSPVQVSCRGGGHLPSATLRALRIVALLATAIGLGASTSSHALQSPNGS